MAKTDQQDSKHPLIYDKILDADATLFAQKLKNEHRFNGNKALHRLNSFCMLCSVGA